MRRTLLATAVILLCCYLSLGTTEVAAQEEVVSAGREIDFAEGESERSVSIRVATTGILESVMVDVDNRAVALRLPDGGAPSPLGLGRCAELKSCEHTIFIERGQQTGAFSVVLRATVHAFINGDDESSSERPKQTIDLHVDVAD